MMLGSFNSVQTKTLGECKLLEFQKDDVEAHANGRNIVGQQHTTLLGPTCCVRLHGTTTMLALVAYSLKPVKRLGPCKRTQHYWPKIPNNTPQCRDLLRSFAWAFTRNNDFSSDSFFKRMSNSNSLLLINTEADIFSTRKAVHDTGPCKRTQQVATLLAQQCWELLALVAWCMQTSATTANIVGVSSLFWP